MTLSRPAIPAAVRCPAVSCGLAVAICLGAAPAVASAQTQIDFSQFRFGLNLSPSISWVNTDDNRISGDGTAFGIKLATQAEFFFAPNYAIETGIGFHFNTGGTLLSRYGGRFFTESLDAGSAFNNERVPAGPNVRLDYSVSYLEIPLALRLHTREFGFVRYYVQAPAFTLGIRTGAKANISGGGIADADDFDDVAIDREVAPLALSWGFGGGAEYEVGGGTVLLGGLQFQRVFTDFTKDDDYVYTDRRGGDDPKAGINSITLRLGVLF